MPLENLPLISVIRILAWLDSDNRSLTVTGVGSFTADRLLTSQIDLVYYTWVEINVKLIGHLGTRSKYRYQMKNLTLLMTVSVCLCHGNYYTINTRLCPNGVLMLGQRRRQWANIKTNIGLISLWNDCQCLSWSGLQIIETFIYLFYFPVENMARTVKQQYIYY